ncbi:MAG: orotidine 5'-phosphate decarboxylase / HUMPS family protein [Nanoarchaeota archaeon]|nr:orotidine 5'-phosphate decarboxylase / HUMPS family protein [Nanoarchaeota archaeon]
MNVQLSEAEQRARKRVCLPLDGLNSLQAIKERVTELSPVVGLYKIGYETFTAFGPDSIRLVQASGADVFLDLKYNDIPNTVKGAAGAATRHGVAIFNVHASGGVEMMKAAREGVDKAFQEGYDGPRPKVLGVTVLTSFDEANYLRTFQPLNPILQNVDLTLYLSMKKDEEVLQREFRDLLEGHGLTGVIQHQVAHLTGLVNEAGLDGIICSAADLQAVRPKYSGLIYGTPGIQGTRTKAGEDQKRVFSPGNAVQAGSTFLVVGRAITDGKDSEARLRAGYEILQDMAPYV